ncbi:hypothetical protein JOD43_000118 [Pullulanibacillus pueri]|nr:hypothetical protein [Pullulanibacillus pueri]
MVVTGDSLPIDIGARIVHLFILFHTLIFIRDPFFHPFLFIKLYKLKWPVLNIREKLNVLPLFISMIGFLRDDCFDDSSLQSA